MAKKISQLTQATQVKSDDVTVIVQDGETKKLPLNMMVTKQDIENKKVAGLAKLDEIEATYENDTYTPTIAVKNKSSVKVGEGDGVDYSANVMDGHVKSAILKGNTGYRDIDTGEILEAFEEGRNLELVSVKMPVLKTTGKNLFNKNNLVLNKGLSSESGAYYNADNRHSTNYIEVEGGKNCCISNMKISLICYYDYDKNFIGHRSSLSHAIPNNAKFLRISIDNTVNFEQGQLEINSTSTAYEPYKSNILTVNEDVTLRGIGDVKDELNLLTGEVTERIGEVVLDGSENDWYIRETNDVTIRITNDSLFNAKNINCYCDTIKVSSQDYQGENDVECLCIRHNLKGVGIRINKSRLSTLDDNGLKQWLSQNPITVQYELATESVKTVDLTPSGTHPSTTPYCWKDGHIQLSSSGLLPSLEYSVVTSRAGQISQNAAMVVKNDKRIFDLEILLAGGLVNTTYQALTLQNQVETGLSKVSLSSEKEPDYLLYHMIMKLIEEKAYKLDDLAEKVSVFYLYEKLSDEQFETIYAALYPFAEDEYFESDIPGDDEVIEEPIVDESLEEVEDEVVM